jgi:hypothetical protein
MSKSKNHKLLNFLIEYQTNPFGYGTLKKTKHRFASKQTKNWLLAE